MTVMDVRADNTALTPEQATLAHGMRHLTVNTLRSLQTDCAYPVIVLHYDMVERVICSLELKGTAKEAFTRLAGLPGKLVADALK